ncbi:MAG: DUF1513 domain-containing protein [Alphaproteobacteria bacterium]|nr:DUF1513 domain-containing protein [Alphaproteobacteria bacterium]
MGATIRGTVAEGAQDGAGAANYSALVPRLVGDYAVPAARDLEARLGVLRDRIADLCKEPGTGTASDAAARAFDAAFAETVAAHGRLFVLRFGALAEDTRLERLAFVPDRRGVVRRQVTRLLADPDPAATDAASLRDKSVTQGLSALEWIAYDADGSVVLGDNDAGRAFRCAYAGAIAARMVGLAGEVAEAYRAPAGQTAMLLAPGRATRWRRTRMRRPGLCSTRSRPASPCCPIRYSHPCWRRGRPPHALHGRRLRVRIMRSCICAPLCAGSGRPCAPRVLQKCTRMQPGSATRWPSRRTMRSPRLRSFRPIWRACLPTPSSGRASPMSRSFWTDWNERLAANWPATSDFREASMPSTEIDRRHLLRHLLSGIGAAGLAGTVFGAADAAGRDDDDPFYVAARREADGSHSVAVVGLDGLDRLVIPLPGRGHDVTVCRTTGRCLAFARRPGTFAVIFDPLGVNPPSAFAAVPGRHFYGHGAFSRNGRLAYATENDYAARRGVIGVYDVSGDRPRRIGEFDSGGIGPHDILPMPDGRTLVVANGGIVTHPDTGRKKLNLDDMHPNIALIDSATGDLLGRVDGEAGLSRLSLRHMDVGADSRVWIGGQYQGSTSEHPPLIASLDPNEGRLRARHSRRLAVRPGKLYRFGDAQPRRQRGCRLLSARRSCALLLRARRGVSGKPAPQDACGLAPLHARSFLVSDGEGALLESASPNGPPLLVAARAGLAWDNHLVAVPATR